MPLAFSKLVQRRRKTLNIKADDLISPWSKAMLYQLESGKLKGNMLGLVLRLRRRLKLSPLLFVQSLEKEYLRVGPGRKKANTKKKNTKKKRSKAGSRSGSKQHRARTVKSTPKRKKKGSRSKRR